ncbi:hypothetical protein MSAN_02300700 [Mycena sanguinolenta]|uniref:Apple domain-containing protein n=1 Tax=Mycena sanguinolenta TaxID=230812 RepID=A0A8H6X8C9_9AGAR|nr:hypothetical protein MSAN_02300700 [Mycena sanguinolenta]
MHALSSIASLFLPFVYMVNAAPAVRRAPEESTVFAVYPGWDMSNGNAETIAVVTEATCLQLCAASSTCVAYSYVPYDDSADPLCNLKSTIDVSTFQVNPDLVVNVGLVGACNTFEPVGPTLCFTEFA